MNCAVKGLCLPNYLDIDAEFSLVAAEFCPTPFSCKHCHYTPISLPPPQVSAHGVNTPLVFLNFFTNICIVTGFSKRFKNKLDPHCCLFFRVTEEMFHGRTLQKHLFQLRFPLTQREFTRKLTNPCDRIRCSLHVNSETLLLFRIQDSRFS